MNLYKIHVHSIHYSGVRYLPNIDHECCTEDMKAVEEFAYELVYGHGIPDELDINEDWNSLNDGHGFQFMGTQYNLVLTASTMLAEFMMDLPSFKSFI